ncbi:hypothetical protein ASD10_09575 [Aeromicrobium sp. Root472D3]|nr:hypothetical protein ASD10_09575 [Aeromicrobium sp. Root472D3]
MLATNIDVEDLTGYTADVTDVRKAQAIVEVYAGRTEALVTLPRDREWMKYAICWQVTYMAQDGNSVFEQANVESLRQNDTTIVFGDRAYAISPLAQQAIGRLSWQRSRVIDTRPWYDRVVPVYEWTTD